MGWPFAGKSRESGSIRKNPLAIIFVISHLKCQFRLKLNRNFEIFRNSAYDNMFERYKSEELEPGIGLSKNLQSGSHPSFKFQTKRSSFGTVLIT